jgi:hypothetical protein
MTDVICPLCGKPNPPDRDECRFCLAPLKSGGFIASSEQEGEEKPSPHRLKKAGGKTTSSGQAILTGSGKLKPALNQRPYLEGGAHPVSKFRFLINRLPSGERTGIDDDWRSVEAG